MSRCNFHIILAFLSRHPTVGCTWWAKQTKSASMERRYLKSLFNNSHCLSFSFSTTHSLFPLGNNSQQYHHSLYSLNILTTTKALGKVNCTLSLYLRPLASYLDKANYCTWQHVCTPSLFHFFHVLLASVLRQPEDQRFLIDILSGREKTVFGYPVSARKDCPLQESWLSPLWTGDSSKTAWSFEQGCPKHQQALEGPTGLTNTD